MAGTITESAHQSSVTTVFLLFFFPRSHFQQEITVKENYVFFGEEKNVICRTRPISQSHGSNSVRLGCVETAGKSHSSQIPSQIHIFRLSTLFLATKKCLFNVRCQRSEWADCLVAIELQCRATPLNYTATTIKRCIHTHRTFYSNSAQNLELDCCESALLAGRAKCARK